MNFNVKTVQSFAMATTTDMATIACQWPQQQTWQLQHVNGHNNTQVNYSMSMTTTTDIPIEQLGRFEVEIEGRFEVVLEQLRSRLKVECSLDFRLPTTPSLPRRLHKL